jgi:hypothetical protein
MAAVFTRPLAFTVLGADQGTIAMAANANDDRVGMVWRTTGTAGYAILDMGAGAVYDTVAIVGSTLASSDTVRVRTGTAVSGVGITDTTAKPAYTGNKPDGFTTKTVFTLGTRTERYVRIDFVSAAIVEVQRIVVGPSIATIGLDYGPEHSIVDSSDIGTILGADTVEAGLRKAKWKFSMSMVSETDWRNSWMGFFARVGKSTPILFCPFSDVPDNFQADVVYGRLRTDATATIPGGKWRVVELTVEGLAL